MPPVDYRFTRVQASRVDKEGDRREVVDLREGAYVFLGSAVAKSIEAPWTREVVLDPSVVHVRLVTGGIFRTRRTRIAPLQRKLDAARFFQVDKGLQVNLDKITELDLDGRVGRVGFRIGGNTEWVRVSRRAAYILRTIF